MEESKESQAVMIEARQKAGLSAFLVLSLGVLANLLVFQPQAEPARHGKLIVSAAAKTDPGTEPASSWQDQPAAQEIRQELVRLGYLPSNSQSLDRFALHAAVMQFQLEAGMPVNGQPADSLLATLILQGTRPEPRNRVTPDIQTGTPAQTVVRKIQTSLAKRGYTITHADGTLTSQTLRAIREFQMDSGMEATGEISAGLMSRLQAVPGRG